MLSEETDRERSYARMEIDMILSERGNNGKFIFPKVDRLTIYKGIDEKIEGVGKLKERLEKADKENLPSDAEWTPNFMESLTGELVYVDK